MSLIIVCKVVCLPFCKLNILCNVNMSVQGVFICHVYISCHSSLYVILIYINEWAHCLLVAILGFN